MRYLDADGPTPISTGQYRHSAALGALTFAGVYGGLALSGPLQVATVTACGVTFAVYVWRVLEADWRLRLKPKDKPDMRPARPMVTDRKIGGATVTVGRTQLGVSQWRAIARQAMKNGGAVTRDVLKAAGMPREVYQRTGEIQRDLVRVGYCVEAGRSVRLVPRGAEWMRNPLPQDGAGR